MDRFIENYKNGFPYLKLVAAATPGKGILVMDEAAEKAALADYGRFTGTAVKFVPASGAASRMFKELFEGRNALAAGEVLGAKPARFVNEIRNFAFYTEERYGGKTPMEILDRTIGEDGLDYGNKPKGQILFHRYPGDADIPAEVRTAFEEHLVEGALYAADAEGNVNLHFTVTPAHQEGFGHILNEVAAKYEERFGCRYHVTFSIQDPATDIIAVNEDNTPFLKADGTPLYRPGGHGALLKNLNGVDGDVVFLKNIDNVVHQRLIEPTVRWKKILAGKLLSVRSRIYSYLESLDSMIAKGRTDKVLCADIEKFLQDEFAVKLPHVPESELPSVLHAKLNRPVRVCGMVRNEGEPGGGPFIVQDADGSTSLQILESAQIDKNDPESVRMLADSTHFNPVDVVCSFIDYKGHKFNLEKFVDPRTGFISGKSYEGRELKAQELPGLWNGSMSDWNTVFVEVPLITFNPVKTVLDLLRPEHRS